MNACFLSEISVLLLISLPIVAVGSYDRLRLNMDIQMRRILLFVLVF